MVKEVLIKSGTIRIGKDLHVYEYSSGKWKHSSKQFPSALEAIKLFKAHHNLESLVDKKNPRFFKGQIYQGQVQGARLDILPDGKKLDKAYSLFAKDLTFHDESSHNHWDVIYQNPNGKYAYVYALSKRNASVRDKYKKVEEFAKKYPRLHRTVTLALHNPKDSYALPMYTLLATHMRVGNETYFKANGHKGLTTLTKNDITIKGNTTTFSFKAKSGVPMTIAEEFPEHYISRMRQLLKEKKSSDFIFSDQKGAPLKDTYFMEAFEHYCGEKFYPHIVRSYYATSRAQEFLDKHTSATKQEIKELFTSIAEKLGHKRFVKKEHQWKDSYNVTIHYYLEPHVLEKVNSLIK